MPSLLIYLIIQTESSEQLQVYVYQLKPPLKPLHLQPKMDLKTIDIIPCNKNLIVQIFQKVVPKTDSSR